MLRHRFGRSCQPATTTASMSTTTYTSMRTTLRTVWTKARLVIRSQVTSAQRVGR